MILNTDSMGRSIPMSNEPKIGFDLPECLPKHVRNILIDIIGEIKILTWVDKIILYGSYAKGCYDRHSDLDLAVFVKKGHPCHINEYRQLAKICRTPEIDIQVQAFCVTELDDPNGIVDEIVEFGIDITWL